MSVTYTWKVEQIECRPEVGEYENVVSVVHWRLFGADGSVQDSVYGSEKVDLVESVVFTPFEELIEETVIGWVQTKLGTERITTLKGALDTMIADRIAPPVVSPPLPWSAA